MNAPDRHLPDAVFATAPPGYRPHRKLDPDRWRSNRHGLPPGMSPADRIAARVRHRVKETQRRQLREGVERIASLAEEIDELKAKAVEEERAAVLKLAN